MHHMDTKNIPYNRALQAAKAKAIIESKTRRDKKLYVNELFDGKAFEVSPEKKSTSILCYSNGSEIAL